MKLLQMGKGIFKYYRENVKGNENTPYKIAQRKLTRNAKMAVKVKISDSKTLYLYGELHILVDGNKITKIINHKGDNANWFWKDLNLYNELNHKLGINEPKQKRKVS